MVEVEIGVWVFTLSFSGSKDGPVIRIGVPEVHGAVCYALTTVLAERIVLLFTDAWLKRSALITALDPTDLLVL